MTFGWTTALLLLFGFITALGCLWAAWPKRRNPVIRAKPQPDSRVYSQKDFK